MNKRTRLVATVALLLSIAMAGCAQGTAASDATAARQVAGIGRGAGGPGQGFGRGNGAAGRGFSADGSADTLAQDTAMLIADIQVQDLSVSEQENLMYMWEEEKLARDVYAALFARWNLPIFENISRSEQTHMDSVALLIERYELEQPGSDGETGRYSDPALQALYDELVVAGESSLAEALRVGATIEDLDIADLQKGVAMSDNDDLRVVYQNLMKGSRNHIRSFIAQLERVGETYDATYITDAYLERVLEINREVAVITTPEYHL